MSRKPSCKTCVSYQPQSDGTVICDYNGTVIENDSQPLFDGGLCYERKLKKKLSPIELSEIRSAAGKKGGSKKRGRIPKSQIQINTVDFKVLSAYASKIKKQTIVSTFHDIVVEQIVARYPELKPPEWID